MKSSVPILVLIALSMLVCGPVSRDVNGQVRGVYPLGMSATNSGVTPSPGFSYVNQLLIYSRNELRGSKYFKEFSNRSTFQGQSVQFSGAIHF